jgi:hypothetical protein
MTMPFRRCLLVAVALIAPTAIALPSRAEEAGEYLSTAMLLPESREVLARAAVFGTVEMNEQSFARIPVFYSELQARSHARQNAKPFFDFAFAFSRAVAGGDPADMFGPIVTHKRDKIAASMQHQDLVLAELQAREDQISDDLEIEPAPADLPVSGVEPAAAKLNSAPINLQKAWEAPPMVPTKGWSGMTLAIEGVVMRFADEGANFYR